MPTLLLVLGLGAGLFTVNALVPRRGRLLLIPSFVASWLTIELAPWLLLAHAALTGAVIAWGGLSGQVSWTTPATVASLAIGWCGLVVILVRAHGTTASMRSTISALIGAGGATPERPSPRFPLHHTAFPILMTRRRGVERVRNLVYAEVDGKPLRLDVYRPREASGNRPGVLQVHGGAWVMGDKREQGIPLLNHLAACGWVGLNANYRLSPRVAFPAHLIDLKRAIAWYRSHAAAYGADPDFLCVTGGSAGGHLAALLALTPNDARYQAGFETVDTTVRAAVPLYGVYDLTDRLHTFHRGGLSRFIEPVVMQARVADDPAAFARASPVDRVRRDAPPFLVIHGTSDTLTSVVDARFFVSRLREISRAPVLYAELRGAQHAFDIFPSYRTARVVEAVERFLASVRTGWLASPTQSTEQLRAF